MSTMNTILNSFKQNVNSLVVEGLTDLGITTDQAVKLVEENDFDIISSSEQNPVAQF